MDTKHEEKLGTAPVLPLIFNMALPSVVAQVVNLMYNLVDRMYIGRIPVIGTAALGGIGLTSSIILFISAFSLFVGGGGAPIASIALGSGDREKAEKILGNGFIMIIVFTVITSILSYLYMQPIFVFMGASENNIGYAKEYFSVYLIGTLFVMMSTGLNTFINTQGRPEIGMFSVLIGAVCNIVLDPIFIFSLNMGVKGAAIATVISQFLSFVWVVTFLFSKKATLRIKPKYFKPDLKIIGSVMSLGVSPFVMAITESLVGLVLNGKLSGFGDIYVSALTIMQSAMQILSVPLTGFTQGLIPVLSYNYGHKNVDRVKQIIKVFFAFMVSGMFAATLFMMIFPKLIAGIFTNDEVLIKVVAQYMPLFICGMLVFGLQRACQNTFVALGKAKVSLFIAILRKGILLIPLAYLFPIFFGVKGVYLAEAVADITSATICTMIFFLSFPSYMKIISIKYKR